MVINQTYFGAIEAGGTKFICAIFDAERNIIAETRIDTSTPEITIGLAVDFFLQQKALGYEVEKIGIGSFGPLDLRVGSDTYGFITKTPKPNWSDTDLLTPFVDALGCQIWLDTDVNAAAVGEFRWGAGVGQDVVIYVTVGTGVGGGVVINGRPLHGLVHPEIGHMLMSPPAGIEGVCPFHKNCVEGLISGTALRQIWGEPAENLPPEHPCWEYLTTLLAQFSHNLMMTYSPQRIIFGGGVMQREGLLPTVQSKLAASLADYVQFPAARSIEDIVCLPGLSTRAGILGALALID